MPAPIPKKISQILPKFQNVAQTSHYLVKFGLPPHYNGDGYSLADHLRRKGLDFRFAGEDIGLLCSSASLPGSAFATSEVVGNYQGVVERFAHTRNFTQISLDFYVDNEYKSLKFLEHWMEYISGSSQPNQTEESYYFRMRYPEDYKSNKTKIVKFERNYRQFIEYTFIGLFPLSLNSIRVSYEGAQVLKATCNFSYDRYIAGETTSYAMDKGIAFNEVNAYNQRHPSKYLNSTLYKYSSTQDNIITSNLTQSRTTAVNVSNNMNNITNANNNPINADVAHYNESLKNNPKLQAFLNNFGPEEK